jgi:polysaccharide biosynthesis/export protein
VPASGSSVAQIREQLARRLGGGYVRNPRISVEVSVYRPINVFGEVKNAGQFAFRPGLTVQDAIAMAGGFTYRANSHTAYVRRSEAKGEQTVQIDTERPPVMPGDTIRVPERFF